MKPKYAPKPGSIGHAIVQGRNSGLTYAEIRQGLASAGVKTEINSLQSHASHMRRKGAELPSVKKLLVQDRVRVILAAERDRLPTSHCAKELGLSRAHIIEIKKQLRSRGISLEKYIFPRRSQERKPLQPSSAEAKWINANYASIERCARAAVNSRRLGQFEHEFVDFVNSNVPRMMRSYNPEKSRTSLLNFIKIRINRYAVGDFWRSRMHKRLQIVSLVDVRRIAQLLRATGEQGLAIEAAARKLNIDLVKARRLLELYNSATSLENTLPLKEER